MADLSGIMIPIWMFIVLIGLIVVGPLGGVFLGAWITVRARGLGNTLLHPSEPKNEPASYVKDLFDDLGEAQVLRDEPLSEAAQRIREQKTSTVVDHVAEAEGLV